MTSTKVIAFYGFKGGSGRSLVMGHLAGMLAAADKSVLMIDGDLEAPGLGDFFDVPGAATFDRWRASYGLTDLMRDLVTKMRDGEMNSAQDRRREIRRIMLSADGVLRRIDNRDKGIIRLRVNETEGKPSLATPDEKATFKSQLKPVWLLGPGSHRATKGLNAYHYVANFLDFDWSAFARQGGKEILAELGQFLRTDEHGFDYILFDARTGYNFPAILFVQHLATHIVGVSTWSWQAIDGMARMLPVMTNSQRANESIEPILAMNKGFEGRLPIDDRYKRRVLPHYFREIDMESRMVYLPFVEYLQRSDKLIWSQLDWDAYRDAGRRRQTRQEMRSDSIEDRPEDSISRGVQSVHDEEAHEFCEKLAKIYRAVTGDTPDQSVFETLFSVFGARSRSRTSEVGSTRHTFGRAVRPSEEDSDKALSEPVAVSEFSETLLERAREQSVNSPGEAAEDIQLEEFVNRFNQLGGGERKLVRNEILRGLEEMEPGNDGSQRRHFTDLIRRRFYLDLDPTEAVNAIARFVDPDSTSPREDLASLLSGFVNRPADFENTELAEDLARIAGQVGSEYLLLADYPEAIVGNRSPHEQAPLTKKMCQGLARLLGTGNPELFPSSESDLLGWNVLDLVEPLAFRARVLMHSGQIPDEDATALRDAVVGLGDELLGYLKVGRDYYAVSDGLARWLYFVQCAISIRRHGISYVQDSASRSDKTSFLTEREVADLRKAAQLPPPAEAATVAGQQASGSHKEARDRLDRLSASLSLEVAANLSAETESLVSELSKAFLDYPLAHRVGSESAQAWARSLGRAATLANSCQRAPDLLSLSRRALRLSSTDPARNFSLVSGAISGAHGLGALISHEVVQEITSEITKPEPNPNLYDQRLPWEFQPWSAAAMCVESRYEEARALLVPLLDEARGTMFDSSTRINSGIELLQSLHAAYVGLDDLDNATEILSELNRARASSHHTWARRRKSTMALIRQAQVLLAYGEDGAEALLDTACTRLQYPLRTARIVLAQVRLLIAAKVASPQNYDEEAEVDSVCADIAELWTDCSDSRAAEWIGAEWNGAGLFAPHNRSALADSRVRAILAPAIEAALRGEKRDAGERLLARWRAFVRRYDDISDQLVPATPTEDHSIALMSAFEWYLHRNEADVKEARAARDRYLSANGGAGGQKFKAVFAFCEVE